MTKVINGKGHRITFDLNGERITLSSDDKPRALDYPAEGYSGSFSGVIVCSGRWHRQIRIHGHESRLQRECREFDDTISDDIRKRLHLPPYEGFKFTLWNWFEELS